LKYFNKFLPHTIYDWLKTSPNSAEQLTAVDFSFYYRIIIIGGDGTIRDIANFLLKNQIDLPIAIIPAGSANILACNLGIPTNLTRAIKIACLGKEKIIDVALLNNQLYYLVSLSLGHGSKIIKETKRGLKVRFGFLSYLWMFLKQSKKYKTVFKFTIDNKKYKISGNTMIIANALSFFRIKPLTPINFADGLLEVLIFKNATKTGLLITILSLLLGKKRYPFLFKVKGKKIIVEDNNRKREHAQIDGEPIKIDRAEVEIIPHKLRIIVP